MEILVLMMLALFLGIIAISVVMYVVFKKNAVNKKFDKRIDRDLDYPLDDDEDDEIQLPNITLPNNLNQLLAHTNFEDEKMENKEDVIVQDSSGVSQNTENLSVESLKKQENNAEVINILIDKKNYIFLANNHKVSRNEHLKIIINNKIYFGTVIKPNYIRDINLLKVKPRKLIIVKNKTKKVEIEDRINDDLEFIPIKKGKIRL